VNVHTEDLNLGLKTKKILLNDLSYKINMCMSVEYINRQTVTNTQIKIQVSLEFRLNISLHIPIYGGDDVTASLSKVPSSKKPRNEAITKLHSDAYYLITSISIQFGYEVLCTVLF
jgi:hypothetical protein